MAVSPFKRGNGIVLQTFEYILTGLYLDSNPSNENSQSVYLSAIKGQGCYWDVVVLPNHRIRLRRVASTNKEIFLNSNGAFPTSNSVYLSDQTAGNGSHWSPTRRSGGDYWFKSNTSSGKNRYLCGNRDHRKDNSVYLVETNTPENTRWNILLTHYAGESVQSIISAVYPSVPISSCEQNGTYGSLEYDRLHSIWKDMQSSNDQTTPIANDFAVCLKAEVYKHSYDSDSPWPNDKGSLCGIMWGSIGGKMCALNFTIDPFQNLILFDSQNGQKIATDKFTPTFCMA